MAKDDEVLSSPTTTLVYSSSEKEEDEISFEEHKELYKELCNDHVLALKKIKKFQKKIV